jgi:hypothetical protein
MTWEDLGNDLRAGRVSIKDFRDYFSRGPASLHDIPVTNIQIVDHLGQNIPVPIMFCSSWKVRLFVTPYIDSGSLIALDQEFDYVIKGYCGGRPGHLLVKQGDYQMIRAKDNQTVDPSEFAKAVEPEMTLEMSIVLRQKTRLQVNMGKCPQCRHVNPTANATHGWIEW